MNEVGLDKMTGGTNANEKQKHKIESEMEKHKAEDKGETSKVENKEEHRKDENEGEKRKAEKDGKIDENSSRMCKRDVQTRWNSTYMMLDTAEKFQKAFERLEVEDEHFCLEFSESEKKKGPPLIEDWGKARVIVKFLKVFYDVTLRISGSLCVTSNRFFHEICMIKKQIKKYSKATNPFLSDMARNMRAKFEKYWGDNGRANYLLFVAVVLDPRYKLHFVKFTLSHLYEEEMSKEIGKKVEDMTRRLYNEYVASNMGNEIDLTSLNQLVVGDEDEDEDDDEDYSSKFVKHLIKQDTKERKTELDKYLCEICEQVNEKFDILNWWKVNSSRYKILAKMAKDVFAIPLSTVASESAFSTGGRVLDPFRSSLTPFRSSLTPKSVEALTYRA